MIDTPHAVTPTDTRAAEIERKEYKRPERSWPRCASCRDAGLVDTGFGVFPCPHCNPPRAPSERDRRQQHLAAAIVTLALCTVIVAIVGAKVAGWLP